MLQPKLPTRPLNCERDPKLISTTNEASSRINPAMYLGYYIICIILETGRALELFVLRHYLPPLLQRLVCRTICRFAPADDEIMISICQYYKV